MSRFLTFSLFCAALLPIVFRSAAADEKPPTAEVTVPAADQMKKVVRTLKKMRELQRPQILWNDELPAAYQEAVDRNVPLVVFMVCSCEKVGCYLCHDMILDLHSLALHEFQDDAVFVITELSRVDGSGESPGEKLAAALKIKVHPTITILDPDTSVIRVRAILRGLFSEEELKTEFTRIFRDNQSQSTPAKSDL